MNKSFQQELQKIAFGNSGSKPLNGLPRLNLPTNYKGFTMRAFQFSSNSSQSSSLTSSLTQKLGTALFLLFLVLVVLVFVHFYVRPIFPQWIVTSVPGLGDSVTYWKSQEDIQIISQSDSSFPLTQRSSNYTLMMDVQIDYPSAMTSYAPRLLFYRAAQAADTSCSVQKSNTLLTILPSFNVAVHMDPLLNDMYITVMTIAKLQGEKGEEVISVPETVNIPNFPIEKAIRLTIIVAPKFLEVYMNGLLYKTKSFHGTVQETTGDLYPIPTEIRKSSTPFARVQQLQVWDRILTSGEVQGFGIPPPFPPVSRILDSNNASCKAQQTPVSPASSPSPA